LILQFQWAETPEPSEEKPIEEKKPSEGGAKDRGE